MDQVTLARIVSFRGSWDSGLAELVVYDYSERRNRVLLADSGPLGRALNQLYGAGLPGNRIDNDAIRGKVIYYSADATGYMDAFTPASSAIPA